MVEKRVLSLGPDVSIDLHPQHLANVMCWGNLWRRLKTGSRTRSINAVNRGDEFKTEEGHIVRCEMDYHANTCVAGPDFKILG